MRVKAAIAALMGLVLTGCAKPLEVASITEIKPPPGSQGLDIYASRRNAGEKVPDFAGDQVVDVRSYVMSEGGGTGDEFAGATCELKSRDFSVNLTTPAKVRVPIYRAQSSPLTVQCQKDGFEPKLAEASVFNVTKEERLQQGASGGVVGVLFVAAINAASDETTHDFAYPTIKVLMTPLGAAKPSPAVAAVAQ